MLASALGSSMLSSARVQSARAGSCVQEVALISIASLALPAHMPGGRNLAAFAPFCRHTLRLRMTASGFELTVSGEAQSRGPRRAETAICCLEKVVESKFHVQVELSSLVQIPL